MNTTIKDVTDALDGLAPSYLQESYDNAGLISGCSSSICTGVLCCLDVTEEVLKEAIQKNCNLVVSHHPIVFRPLKKISGDSYVERVIIEAIKNDIALFAVHTNLDNVLPGVNRIIAAKLGLNDATLRVLQPKSDLLSKLYTYVPVDHAAVVRDAIFRAGAGGIGRYNECSFNVEGEGTFRPLEGSDPFIGKSGGARETVREVKMEFVFPSAIQSKLLKALFAAHPYEEVAYEVIRLANDDQYTGSGLMGELPEELTETELLSRIKKAFGLSVIRHTQLLGRPVKKIAVCGGAGSFLTRMAIARTADVFITSDIRYHDFFDADGKILLADIGHYESEQFTIELLTKYLQDKLPTFAVLKTEVNTNPVNYFV